MAGPRQICSPDFISVVSLTYYFYRYFSFEGSWEWMPPGINAGISTFLTVSQLRVVGKEGSATLLDDLLVRVT